MELMKSKNYQTLLTLYDLGLRKLQIFFKKQYLKNIIQGLQDNSAIVNEYDGRQGHRQTYWFLEDHLHPDTNITPLKEDTEAAARSLFCHNSSKKFTSFKRQYQRRTVKYGSSSFSFSRVSMSRKSSQARNRIQLSTLKPLETKQSSQDLESEDNDDDIINRFRQQKTRRQQFKNKMVQAEKAQIFRLIDRSITNMILNSNRLPNKKEKIQQMEHFVSMDVTVRDLENVQPEKLRKVPQKFYKNLQSKTERSCKNNQIAHNLTNENYKELKHEQKIYLLNVPNELKLGNGVSLRENQKHPHNHENPVISGANRKKLQFLKNGQIDPIKIKMSQLMSFKKITTSTNLAYCSSMKTIKDLPKEGTQSKISIDSKQFLEEPSCSKKLIKIANRKIYEQLLIDINDDGTQLSMKKGRLKPKKEGKVRFDNISAV